MKKVLMMPLLLGSMSAMGMWSFIRNQISSASTTRIDQNDELVRAAQEGRSHRVKLLIEGGADVNYANKDDFTALTYAAARGHYNTVALLLDHKADIDREDNLGYTALLDAARMGHHDVVELLIQRGAKINHASKHGYTALMEAARKGHRKVVELLLEHGADVNLANANGDTALNEITGMPIVNYRMAKLLIDNGANINHANKDAITPLMQAARQGYQDIVELLLEHGADVRATLPDGKTTAYDIAVLNGQHNIAELLAKHKGLTTRVKSAK